MYSLRGDRDWVAEIGWHKGICNWLSFISVYFLQLVADVCMGVAGWVRVIEPVRWVGTIKWVMWWMAGQWVGKGHKRVKRWVWVSG